MRETKTTAISILGMHRSGTSLVTRVVNLLGAHLGEEKELMRPTPDNPEGYWEHLQIFIIHERILNVLRRTWDTVFSLPPDWHRSKDIIPFRDELTELVQTRFDQHPVWAWKDPRSSILLPLWRDILTDLGIELRCLLVFRNPLDVARSLKTRDHFSRDEGLGLWLNYNLAMLQNSAGLTRALASYEELIADPAASVAHWAPNFPLQWSRDDEAQRDAIQGVIRADLCHSQSTLRDLTQSGVPTPVVKLTRILQTTAKTGDLGSPAFDSKISSLFHDHASLSRLYAHDFIRSAEDNHLLQTKLRQAEEELAKNQARVIEKDRILAERDSLLNVANAKVQEHEGRQAESRALLAKKQQALAERDNLLAAARVEIQEHQVRLVESQELLVEKQQAITERDDLLGAARAEITTRDRRLAESQSQLADREGQDAVLQTKIDRLEATYSWRITRPLRLTLDAAKSTGQRLRKLFRK